MKTFVNQPKVKDFDSLLQEEFDDFALLASQICNTPISFVSFIDYSRQWFKSVIGLNVQDTPIENTICKDTITQKEVVVFENLLLEKRYCNYPAVTGDLHLRFYAGAPLISSNQVGIGTLCVLDTEARSLTEAQIKSLKKLAQKLVDLIELKIKALQLEEEKIRLQSAKDRLTKHSYMVSHDLKAPVNQMISLSDIVEREIAIGNYAEAQKTAILIKTRGNYLRSFINEMLEFAKCDKTSTSSNSFLFNSMVLEVLDMIGCPSNVKVELPKKLEIVTAEKIALTQIFINLIGNAIKHHGKDEALINVYFEKVKDHYHFFVEDNGVGIPTQQLDKIFNLYTCGNAAKESHGIGLNSVKNIIEEAGGTIIVDSQENIGTKFCFTWPIPKL